MLWPVMIIASDGFEAENMRRLKLEATLAVDAAFAKLQSDRRDRKLRIALNIIIILLASACLFFRFF